METITLNRQQQRRADILTRLCANEISKDDAQRLLSLSRRQINRIVRNYKSNGLKSIVHGNSGRVPVNKTPAICQEKVLALTGEDGRYHGFNVCHTTDLLIEIEDISIGRSTLDRILREHNIIKPNKRRHLSRRTMRDRSSQEGSLIQIDGSNHDWLCGRGPKMALIGGIDDGTNKIVSLLFRPSEDQPGYLMLLRSMAIDYGLPESLYHDKHTILRSPKEATIEDELAGREPQSQLQRVMYELGIVSIPAHSPQAKGRIERLWQTLQDRLIKEMTLAGVKNIDEANLFLPGFIARFNARFLRKPSNPESAWVTIEPDMDIDYYFSTSESRVVRQDHTIAWHSKTYQILSDEKCIVTSGKRVDVHVNPEGRIYIYSGKHRLPYKEMHVNKSVSVTKQIERQHKPFNPEAQAKRRAWLFQGNAA
jgi:hypothetical protein